MEKSLKKEIVTAAFVLSGVAAGFLPQAVLANGGAATPEHPVTVQWVRGSKVGFESCATKALGQTVQATPVGDNLSVAVGSPSYPDNQSVYTLVLPAGAEKMSNPELHEAEVDLWTGGGMSPDRNKVKLMNCAGQAGYFAVGVSGPQ
ncbi:MAG: hypothetical protein PHD48_07050 [Alphaproteobacteria bacterium]|nr:hypothetical protein [Alphaproteobacteria bacterium]